MVFSNKCPVFFSSSPFQWRTRAQTTGLPRCCRFRRCLRRRRQCRRGCGSTSSFRATCCCCCWSFLASFCRRTFLTFLGCHHPRIAQSMPLSAFGVLSPFWLLSVCTCYFLLFLSLRLFFFLSLFLAAELLSWRILRDIRRHLPLA